MEFIVLAQKSCYASLVDGSTYIDSFVSKINTPDTAIQCLFLTHQVFTSFKLDDILPRSHGTSSARAPPPPPPRACPRALNSRHNSLVQDGVHKERICILLTPLRQAREHGICKLLQPYLKKQTNPVPTPPFLRRVLTRTGTRSTSLKALSDSQSGAGFSSSLGIIVPPANKKRHSSWQQTNNTSWKRNSQTPGLLTGSLRSSLSLDALCVRAYISIRQLSSFRASTLWFLDLAVATCHIQYTFLSLHQFLFHGKTDKTRKYSKSAIFEGYEVTRRAKH